MRRDKTVPLCLDERATEDWWKTRKIDWDQAYFIEHTHRDQLIDVLRGLKFDSILEVGCGAGKNLDKIRKEFGVKVQGIDISEDAVKETLRHLIWAEVGMAENINLPDKSVDLILTDACLIYVPPEKIEETIKGMISVARKYIVCCEWHNDKDVFDGHWVYNYAKLFKDYETKFTKIHNWAGNWETYGNIIIVEIKDKQ